MPKSQTSREGATSALVYILHLYRSMRATTGRGRRSEPSHFCRRRRRSIYLCFHFYFQKCFFFKTLLELRVSKRPTALDKSTVAIWGFFSDHSRLVNTILILHYIIYTAFIVYSELSVFFSLIFPVFFYSPVSSSHTFIDMTNDHSRAPYIPFSKRTVALLVSRCQPTSPPPPPSPTIQSRLMLEPCPASVELPSSFLSGASFFICNDTIERTTHQTKRLAFSPVWWFFFFSLFKPKHNPCHNKYINGRQHNHKVARSKW